MGLFNAGIDKSAYKIAVCEDETFISVSGHVEGFLTLISQAMHIAFSFLFLELLENSLGN